MTTLMAANVGKDFLPEIAFVITVLIPVAILLLASWATVRISPGDSRRTFRGLLALGIGGVAYAAFLSTLANVF